MIKTSEWLGIDLCSEKVGWCLDVTTGLATSCEAARGIGFLNRGFSAIFEEELSSIRLFLEAYMRTRTEITTRAAKPPMVALIIGAIDFD